MDIEERPDGLHVTGVVAYDLAAGYFCEECGRPKLNRCLTGVPSGCKTCDDVITAHRCTGRPRLDALTLGQSWECPDCGSIWTAVEQPDTCGECGRSGTVKGWAVVPGDRLDTAPRYVPYVPVPMRNLLRAARDLAPARPVWSPFGNPGEAPPVRPRECYALPSGAMVHVKPGCRC